MISVGSTIKRKDRHKKEVRSSIGGTGGDPGWRGLATIQSLEPLRLKTLGMLD